MEVRLSQEQTKFQKKLIRGYQAMTQNKKLKKELTAWEETLGDIYRNE